MNHARFDKRFLVAGVALVAATLACSAPSAQAQPTPSQEVAEAFTATPFVVTATPDAAATLAPPTTAAPSSGSTTGGSTTGGTTGGGGASCGYDSLYISDLTIPDGTEIITGNAFTKTWRVQNNGCAEWPGGTSLVFVSGDSMGGPSSIPVPQTAAGGTQDISLNLTAPGAVGTPAGFWQMRTPDGIQFGDKLSVKITVVAAPPPPAATNTPGFILPPAVAITPTPTFMILVPLFPLLTADFTAGFAGKKSCFIGTGYMVKVKNTGSLDLESAYVKFEAPPGTVKGDTSYNEPFASTNSCSGSTASKLAAGDTAWVLGGATLSAIPSGTSAKITIKLCGLDDLGGICNTEVVTFNVP